MGMMSGQAKGPVAEMNVTPMIDLLLVLIIIFMVLAVNEKQLGEEAQIPQRPPDKQVEVPPDRDRTVVVSVREYRGAAHVEINQHEVPWGELQDQLMRIFVSRVEKVAFVKADKEMQFEIVADVIDIIHRAGVEKVGLMTEKVEVARK